MAEPGQIVEPVGIDHRCVGQVLVGLVVVDDDDVEAEPPRLGERLDAGGPQSTVTSSVAPRSASERIASTFGP